MASEMTNAKLAAKLWDAVEDEISYRCTNGHDLCDRSYPGEDCQYCDRCITPLGELLKQAATALEGSVRLLKGAQWAIEMHGDACPTCTKLRGEISDALAARPQGKD